MNYKISKLHNFNKFYKKISNEKSLPLQLKFKFIKFFKDVSAEMESYTAEFNSILDEYCERDADGNPIIEGDTVVIQPDRLEECKEKVKELEELETEINITFTLEEIEPINDLLTLDDLMLLRDFIEY